jgi:hypothetical protein
MRFGQDLCIALVLAVIGTGIAEPAVANGRPEESSGFVEDAMEASGLSEAEMATVRRLITEARNCARIGDEDGAATAMATVSGILGIA